MIDHDKLRQLALNGNGTASPYVSLLCSELLALLDQLAAMTAARDEACDIADGLYNCDGGDLAPFDRIAALRKVCK
jgi:hypothetical protein